MIGKLGTNGPFFGYLLLGVIIIFGPLIAKRFRLPGMLGLLIGGALVGPNMLELLEDFSDFENTGKLGILYLLYLAGLQMDPEAFRRFWRISGGFGLITSAIPFALGTFVTLQLGYSPRAAILIGSFWASFTLIAYPVLKQYDLLKNRAGAATLGASAITDTVSLLVLALVAGAETGTQSGLGLMLMIGLGLAVLGVWCLAVLPWLTRWFFSTLGRGRVLRFMLILVGMNSSAVLAEIVGIEPLLGAFLAGLGLNRLVPNGSELMERVDFIGHALFIPAFLVSVGLTLDPVVMFRPSTIRLALCLIAALLVGKALAARITGFIFRLSRAETGLLFSVSVAQAAATLAATVIGRELELYGDEVVNAVMFVIAVSLFITSQGTPKFAERIEQPAEKKRRLGDVVLAPAHGPSISLPARLRLAGQIAKANGGLVLPVVVAVNHIDPDLMNAKARKDEIDDALHALGLAGDSRIRLDRSLADGIQQAALENDASLILMDWKGPRPITEFFVESVADEVSRRSDRPVAVAALSEVPVEQVVLAISKNDLHASSLDSLQSAVGVATIASLATKRPLIVGPVSPEPVIAAGIAFPAKTEFEPDGRGVLPWIEKRSRKNRLVVSLSRGSSFDASASEIKRLGCSLVVVASK